MAESPPQPNLVTLSELVTKYQKEALEDVVLLVTTLFFVGATVVAVVDPMADSDSVIIGETSSTGFVEEVFQYH
jgi:hypothetical protein